MRMSSRAPESAIVLLGHWISLVRHATIINLPNNTLQTIHSFITILMKFYSFYSFVLVFDSIGKQILISFPLPFSLTTHTWLAVLHSQRSTASASTASAVLCQTSLVLWVRSQNKFATDSLLIEKFHRSHRSFTTCAPSNCLTIDPKPQNRSPTEWTPPAAEDLNCPWYIHQTSDNVINQFE